MSHPSGVDNMYFRIVKILTFAGGQSLTNATGFFFLHDDFLYLITSRHVVIHPTVGHFPDCLHVSLHSSVTDLRQRSELSIPLYVDGVPRWYQHTGCADADLVAVAINDPNVLSGHVVVPFRSDDILSQNEILPLGQDVLILGFPLGFHDTVHNLPIVRRATIASSFPHPFKGEPYFLTDATLHRGMSGSPVIARIHGDCQPNDAGGSKWRLLGIHASALDVSDRDPVQDERLALNTAWYATLITEMLPDRSVASSEGRRIANSNPLLNGVNVS